LMRVSTERLEMRACSVEVARVLARGDSDVEALLGARLPEGWPTPELRGLLPLYAAQVEADPSALGWGVWLMVHRGDGTVIGDLGFKGKPDGGGRVEIGYRVVPAYRRRGYATEATRALVDWALAQEGVARILAECDPDNVGSIRVLEKLGMRRLEGGGGLLRWELRAGGK